MADELRIPANLPGNLKTQQLVQEFNMRRKFAIGFDFPTSATVQTFPGISFPGTARMLLGFSCFDNTGNPLNKLSITINNENIIDNISWAEFNRYYQYGTTAGFIRATNFEDEYYSYPRLLSGHDGVIVKYDAATAGHFWIVFRYKSVASLI